MLTLLLLLFSCSITTATLDVKPFVSTAIGDFLTQKEAGSSDVFSVLIENYEIDGSEIIGLTIIPNDSQWKFLLSNADSLGTSFVSISSFIIVRIAFAEIILIMLYSILKITTLP